jgi:hypothetical protein
MNIEIGHYYQDGNGDTIKVLAREQKQMLPQMDERGHLDTDPAHAVLVDCFRCRPYNGDDFYVLPTGQACDVWKGKDGAVYSLPVHPSFSDLIKESDPEDIDAGRYEDDFTATWLIDHFIGLTLRAQARNGDLAYAQLPAIEDIERALRSLFEVSGLEVEAIFYDSEQGDIEEEVIEE